MSFKGLVLDIDGTLTNDALILDNNGVESKSFCFLDIMGISNAKKEGIKVGVISGEGSKIVDIYCDKIGIEDRWKNCKYKEQALREFSEIHGIEMKDIVYIGNDINDVKAMKIAGISACPKDAHIEVREAAKLISDKNCGHGAVRDIIDKVTMLDKNNKKGSWRKEKISEHVRSHIKAIEETILGNNELILEIAVTMNLRLKRGGKILIVGNGGSAADAMHFSTELVGKYKKIRKGIPSIALNCDQALITCISNDFGYEKVFERQVETLGNRNDILIALTTSGRSENIIKAIQKASSMGIATIAITGKNIELIEKAIIAERGYIISAESDDTAIIQEVTYTLLHVLAGILDEEW